MKLFHRLNTVFYKLIISYTILVLITTMLVGVTSYIYFSNNFNSEVSRVNNKLLEYQRRTTDENVFDKAATTYINLVTDRVATADIMTLLDEPLSGNHAKINAVQNLLKNIVSANNDHIDAIEIYFRNNNIAVSSDYGYTSLSENARKDLAQWIDRLNTSESSFFWLENTAEDSPPDSNRSKDVTLVGSYPFNVSGNANKGGIAVHIKKSALYDIIKNSSPNEAGEAFLIGGSGRVIVSNELRDYLGEDILTRINRLKEPAGNMVESIGGVKSIISYTTLQSNGWKLVNVTPVDHYYLRSNQIQRMLILISAVAIIVGLLVANLFTFNIYNPLKSILSNARRLFGDYGSTAGKTENEYVAINEVINNLSVKVTQLETTLQTNLPIIKHNFVMKLLQSAIPNKRELKERSQLLDLRLENLSMAVALLELDEELMSRMTVENNQFIKYNLIQQIESFSNVNQLLLAIEWSERRLAVVFGSSQKLLQDLTQIIHHISSYAYANFVVTLSASIGSWVDNPLKLSVSCKEAEILSKYRYFLPEKSILAGESLLQREQSQEEISEKPLQDFEHSLKLRDMVQVKSAIEALNHYTRAGNYSAEHCHYRWQQMIEVFHQYIKGMNYSSRDIIGEDLLEELKQTKHIGQFQAWLIHVADVTFDFVEEKIRNKSGDMIAKAQQYIIDNLDKELSLNSVSDVIMISPRYLSKIFKDETGVNFVEYVTEQRLMKAKELILSTDDTIEQIGVQVGFNSPAYFIKKFRETYGMTPKNFKYSHHDHANDHANDHAKM